MYMITRYDRKIVDKAVRRAFDPSEEKLSHEEIRELRSFTHFPRTSWLEVIRLLREAKTLRDVKAKDQLIGTELGLTNR